MAERSGTPISTMRNKRGCLRQQVPRSAASNNVLPALKVVVPMSKRGCLRQQPPTRNAVVSPWAEDFISRTNSTSIVGFVSEDFRSLILDLSLESFDEYMPIFVSMLSGFTDQPDVIKMAVNTILETCVSLAPLRCVGANLCNCLAQNIVSENSGKVFRKCLLDRCQEEFAKRRTTVRTDAHWLHGFVHFLGELFLHLALVDATGSGVKYDMLGTALLELLELLIEFPTTENFICIGYVLEITRHDLNVVGLAKVIVKVQNAIEFANNLSEEVKKMMTEVISNICGEQTGRKNKQKPS